jgi:hypothetical protein
MPTAQRPLMTVHLSEDRPPREPSQLHHACTGAGDRWKHVRRQCDELTHHAGTPIRASGGRGSKSVDERMDSRLTIAGMTNPAFRFVLACQWRAALVYTRQGPNSGLPMSGDAPAPPSVTVLAGLWYSAPAMRQVRARLGEWTALALVLSIASFVTPRAGLYFHHHTGGDHLHVHLDEDGHDHHHIGTPHHGHHHHRHHVHVAHATASGPGIETPDDDGTGHWHSQDVFQRAVSPAVKAANHSEAVRVLATRPAWAAVDRPALPVRVRGPPLPA